MKRGAGHFIQRKLRIFFEIKFHIISSEARAINKITNIHSVSQPRVTSIKSQRAMHHKQPPSRDSLPHTCNDQVIIRVFLKLTINAATNSRAQTELNAAVVTYSSRDRIGVVPRVSIDFRRFIPLHRDRPYTIITVMLRNYSLHRLRKLMSNGEMILDPGTRRASQAKRMERNAGRYILLRGALAPSP